MLCINPDYLSARWSCGGVSTFNEGGIPSGSWHFTLLRPKAESLVFGGRWVWQFGCCANHHKADKGEELRKEEMWTHRHWVPRDKQWAAWSLRSSDDGDLVHSRDCRPQPFLDSSAESCWQSACIYVSPLLLVNVVQVCIVPCCLCWV